jgi:hypothetical protein
MSRPFRGDGFRSFEGKWRNLSGAPVVVVRLSRTVYIILSELHLVAGAQGINRAARQNSQNKGDVHIEMEREEETQGQIRPGGCRRGGMTLQAFQIS